MSKFEKMLKEAKEDELKDLEMDVDIDPEINDEENDDEEGEGEGVTLDDVKDFVSTASAEDLEEIKTAVDDAMEGEEDESEEDDADAEGEEEELEENAFNRILKKYNISVG